MSWLPDWLTGYDAENAARGARADAELNRMAQEDYLTPGGRYYSEENAAAVRRNYETDAYLNDAQAHEAIDQAFDEGWQEGRQNVSNTITGALNRIIADPLRAIIGGLPWWLWLAAALFVFGYFGGFGWLKRKYFA